MNFRNFCPALWSNLDAFCGFSCVKFAFACRFSVFTGIPSGDMSFPLRIVLTQQTFGFRRFAR